MCLMQQSQSLVTMYCPVKQIALDRSTKVVDNVVIGSTRCINNRVSAACQAALKACQGTSTEPT